MVVVKNPLYDPNHTCRPTTKAGHKTATKATARKRYRRIKITRTTSTTATVYADHISFGNRSNDTYTYAKTVTRRRTRKVGTTAMPVRDGETLKAPIGMQTRSRRRKQEDFLGE